MARRPRIPARRLLRRVTRHLLVQLLLHGLQIEGPALLHPRKIQERLGVLCHFPLEVDSSLEPVFLSCLKFGRGLF